MGRVKENLWWLWLVETVETESWDAFIIGVDPASIDALMISVLDRSDGEQYT
jgi:hypothetical protein